MNIFERALAALAPDRALRRARARSALNVMMNYDAAQAGRRGSSWRPAASDADAAAVRRARLAFIARDMIRNTPLAARAQAVIAGNVVGTGILPKVRGGTASQQAALAQVIQDHLLTTAIDADGRNTLFGLQRLAMNAVVDAGEVLIRRRQRLTKDRLPLALQLQVVEADYIDTSRTGIADAGGQIREGIEYDAIGRRVAYWLFDEHPGSNARWIKSFQSHRVPASEILHIFRQDRPGQMRGVSWFAPVALALQDLADGQDAQLMRQKIAACFAAFVTDDGDGQSGKAGEVDDLGGTIVPGTIRRLKPGEDVTFAEPPAVTGHEEFTRAVLRTVAAGLGITYEALSGDLGNVNFTSYKAGRIEMDQAIAAWQWLLLIPQMMQPIGRWIVEAWALENAVVPKRGLAIDWVAPVRPLIDPAREIGALRDKVRAGFAARQQVIRELGDDPDDVMREQIADAEAADQAGLKFDSDARNAVAGQPGSAGNGPPGGQTDGAAGGESGKGQDPNGK
jgi:lambda family phage portal protein